MENTTNNTKNNNNNNSNPESNDLNILTKNYTNNTNNKNKNLKRTDNKPVSNFYPLAAGFLSSGYHIYNVLSDHKNKPAPNKFFFAGSTLFVFGFSYIFTKAAVRQIDYLEK